jgi:hypothetical protein
MVTALIFLSMLPLVVGAFLSALFLHRRDLAAAGIFFLGVATASPGIREAFRIRLVLHIGQWTGFKGEPIRRDAHPIHFWIRTALHVAVFSIYGAAGALLLVTSANIGGMMGG